ncbi:ABC-transporter periplasmic binding protein MlaC [Roseovarius indicus]|uniref:ABC-transporter periplasmic binding protein MlaC n=2 Tax=Roseovarius indicus TaxID=540747 RepID=A0A5P3A7D8_9RHOB|nr:ABC-transporter periplasmic binding protein MlaC [Roseovarius indicus]SFE26941.1 phospholipid transport system substrate-binding protein [Roseovarius indicus]
MTIPMPSNFTRRRLLGAGLATTTALALPLPAMALNDATARALIDKVVAEINRVIASGKSLGGMIQDFESIFARYADVNIIAQSTLGADSRRASAAQMRAFTDAFRGYIARKYGKQFRQFVGGRIEVQGVRQVKSWHEVISTVYLRGEAPFEVRFLVSDRSGRDLFFDMLIEGVSLRLSERTEIGAMLDARRGNIDALIQDLRSAG